MELKTKLNLSLSLKSTYSYSNILSSYTCLYLVDFNNDSKNLSQSYPSDEITRPLLKHAKTNISFSQKLNQNFFTKSRQSTRISLDKKQKSSPLQQSTPLQYISLVSKSEMFPKTRAVSFFSGKTRSFNEINNKIIESGKLIFISFSLVLNF